MEPTRRAASKLLLSLFNGKTRTGRKGLLNRARHILKCPVVEEPNWYQPMSRAPPIMFGGLPGSLDKRPPVIEFPEDRLFVQYLRKNPTALHTDPIDLNSSTPHPALAFVRRQLELMEQKSIPAEEAYKIVQAEQQEANAHRALADSKSPASAQLPGGSARAQITALEAAQAEEEAVLRRTGVLSEPASTAEGAGAGGPGERRPERAGRAAERGAGGEGAKPERKRPPRAPLGVRAPRVVVKAGGEDAAAAADPAAAA